MREIVTDLTPTHFIPRKACQEGNFDMWMAYFDEATKLSVSVILQPEKDADMGDLIEIILPSVQIWPYDKAPSWAQMVSDDADWAIFVPNFLENDSPELMFCQRREWMGPYFVPGGHVWVECHA